jgi:hypothetical protein
MNVTMILLLCQGKLMVFNVHEMKRKLYMINKNQTERHCLAEPSGTENLFTAEFAEASEEGLTFRKKALFWAARCREKAKHCFQGLAVQRAPASRKQVCAQACPEQS